MKFIKLVEEVVIEMAKKELPDGGDCFDAAFDFMQKNVISGEIPNLKLVHGFVSGQGELNGYRFTHAWCEDDDNVYDYSNGKTFKILKMLYYGIGNINEYQGKYYDKAEFGKMIATYGNKGPWEVENKVYKEKFNPETRRYD
jgi:hypothetical protein